VFFSILMRGCLSTLLLVGDFRPGVLCRTFVLPKITSIASTLKKYWQSQEKPGICTDKQWIISIYCNHKYCLQSTVPLLSQQVDSLFWFVPSKGFPGIFLLLHHMSAAPILVRLQKMLKVPLLVRNVLKYTVWCQLWMNPSTNNWPIESPPKMVSWRSSFVGPSIVFTCQSCLCKYEIISI